VPEDRLAVVVAAAAAAAAGVGGGYADDDADDDDDDVDCSHSLLFFLVSSYLSSTALKQFSADLAYCAIFRGQAKPTSLKFTFRVSYLVCMCMYVLQYGLINLK